MNLKKQRRRFEMRQVKIMQAFVTMLVIVVFAGSGVAAGPAGGGPVPGKTPAERAKIVKFERDTLELRQKMMALRVEMAELRMSDKPDWEAIGAKKKEMAEVGTQIQKKAFEAGIPPHSMRRNARMKNCFMDGWDRGDCRY
jgi:hypothetical protein